MYENLLSNIWLRHVWKHLYHSVSNDFGESHPTSIIYRYIYIFTVLILLFVQIVLMAKRRVPVRWSPRGGRRKVCYHIALSSLKDIQGKKIINLTDARKLFFIQTAQKSRYCFKSLYPWLFARMHVNTETAHLFIDFLCMS